MSPKVECSSALARESSSYHRVALLFVLVAAISGCHRKSGPIAQEQTNLSWLGSMYGMYMSENKGRPPKTTDELRKFLEKTTSPERLTHLKVASINDLFISPRDGKPFAMVSYDKLPAVTAGRPSPVVFYEVQGQNGQRAVAFLGGGTRSVDENELQKMLPAGRKL